MTGKSETLGNTVSQPVKDLETQVPLFFFKKSVCLYACVCVCVGVYEAGSASWIPGKLVKLTRVRYAARSSCAFLLPLS